MKKTLYFIASLFFLATTLLVSSCNQKEVKQSTLDKILTNKTLVVGTTAKQFPFSFKGKDGKLDGLDIHLANGLAKRLGVEVKYEIMDFDELIAAVENGKVDIVLSGVSITTQRNTKVAFPRVYYKSGKSILSKDKNIATGDNTLVNKESITLVTLKGSTSELYVKKRFPKAKLVLVEKNIDALTLLGADKVDGVVADFETCETMAFAYEKSFLFYNNISKETDQEFISPVVRGDDYLFVNLVGNYIDRANEFNKADVIDELWYKYAKQY